MRRNLFVIILLFLIIENARNSVPIVKNIDILDKMPSHSVIATFYNPVKSQCLDDPLITADGSKIDINKLRKGKLKWIAISRDLKRHYKFNDKIYVQSNNPKINGIWEIKDVMGKRHKNRIDFLSSDVTFLSKPVKVKIYKVK